MAEGQATFQARLEGSSGTTIDLAGEMTLGRTEQCEITIADPRISRAHARFHVMGEVVTLEDLGSANGTTVNGIPVNGSMRLAHGDRIAFEKHEFTFSVSGGSDTGDATMIVDTSDATMISGLQVPEAPPAAAPVPAAPAPAAPPAAAPAPAAPPAAAPVAPAAPPPPPPAVAPPLPRDLPGSWTDSGVGEQTRILSMDDLTRGGAGGGIARALDAPHLILVQHGAAGDVYELDPSGGTEPDVWEIGREGNCQIVVPDASVSARHAQLIHDGGRWRLVNLVSANGIFVNGEKRLTAYLSDGDELRFGMATLKFHTAGSARPAAAKDSATAGRKPGSVGDGGGSSLPVKWIVVGVVLIGLVAVGWWLLG